jgi:tetratricopeptide (TPR) repeat protein
MRSGMLWRGIVIEGTKLGRNDPCPCGSGKRYKHCCGIARGAPRAAYARPLDPSAPSSASLSPRELGGLVALIDQGRLTEAEERALVLLKTHPATGIVWKVLSVVLVRGGKNALPALRRAAELLPGDAEAQGNLGSALLAAGQWSEALATLHRTLALRPDDAEALAEAADAAAALGRQEEAIGLYQRALRIDPQPSHVHNNLGNALLALGRCAEAVECYRLALAGRAEDAEVLCNLGDALRQLGELRAAASCSERAIAIDPALCRAHNVLGLCLSGLGERERAVAILRQAITLQPRSVEALTNLAGVLRDLGERREALSLYREAVEIDAERPETYCGLGNTLYALRHLDETVESYRHALALRPDYPVARVSLAAALWALGRREEAEADCRAVLAAAPSQVEALVLLGQLDADRGHFAQAQELFERAVRLDPRCVSAYCSIGAHRKMTPDETAWLSGAQALLAEPLPLAERIPLCYALGKYFDDVGQYESAFQHYREANELTKRYGSGYDGGKLARRVDRLIERFDSALVRELQSRPEVQSGASLSDRSVFIIGMPRSGTSLAEQILASHPQVFGAGEVRFWDDAFAALEKTGLDARAAATLLPAFARDYLARLAASPSGATRVVDKMPANFLYAGLIHAAFPRAHIIHMRRDPIDTCLSIYFQNFFNVSSYSNDLEHLANYYEQYVRVSDHWRSVLPREVLLEVPYEALVADQEGWTRRMLAFIGLPWDPRCLEFHRTERTVITASRWQVRQRMHAGSVGRWQNYERHVGPLRRLTGLVQASGTL